MQAIVYDIGNKWLKAPRSEEVALFEEHYIGLRQKENRIYSDEALLRLPVVDPQHPHSAEWKLREQSARRLLKYIAKKNKPLRVLEVGCGNGWLSHRMAECSNTFVTGIDINAFELQQAARVFKGVQGLQFLYGSVDSPVLINRQFDLVVFAASIQYFQSLPGTLSQCLSLLKPGGEIHLLDSHFYQPGEVAAASERTAQYYRSLGFPGMAASYHHHSLLALKTFPVKILYRANWLTRFVQPHYNPFPWICIKKPAVPCM